MQTVIVKNADVIVTMDKTRREIGCGWMVVRDGEIEALGDGDPPIRPEDMVIDARGCVVTPGLVNTHHHLFQNLTRTLAPDAPLFDWLRTLYPIWARLGPDEIDVSTRMGLCELALSGCTTTSDHLYLFPNGIRLDDSIFAAREVGLRFHATRGSMSIGESAGGLPPDVLTEDENAILDDCARLADSFHDPAPGAMVRIAFAPCSPFSVSRELMRDTAVLAREKGVMLHTHLAENDQDIAYSQERFGCRPGQYVEDLGWTGADVWHAHCVRLNDDEIGLFSRSRTGVAHCPCSNARLGSGIAPVRALRDAEVRVGLGVDGSASNDGASLIGEARQAMLAQRLRHGAHGMAAREALEIATLGGAQVLGRKDIGALIPGKRADFAIWPVDQAPGAWDPVAALVLCAPRHPREVWVEGRPVVREGRVQTQDFPTLSDRHRALKRRLMEG